MASIYRWEQSLARFRLDSLASQSSRLEVVLLSGHPPLQEGRDPSAWRQMNPASPLQPCCVMVDQGRPAPDCVEFFR